MGRVFTLMLLVTCSLFARDYGPAVGAGLPDFNLPDQNGKVHNLASVLGPKGALIVFYRSADW
ncbi:MAG TPA: hypothetical protein VGV35_10925 [Bryobacteraceae bacterium]|nr:hypothetical protein [Bryobacteraceae bacterium]